MSAVDELLALATAELRELPRGDRQDHTDELEHESRATVLVALAGNTELFHDPAGVTYARMVVGEHFETWPTRAKGFKRWLTGRFYTATEKAPNAQALADALNVLEAKAQFEGICRSVYVRVAPDGDGGLYVDLGDSTWRAVHVMAGSWVVVENAPVYFRRTAGMLPLPEPVHGGSLDDLRAFVNVLGDDDWALLEAWLRAALRDIGPYPVLTLNGEQGSAKTTLARMLRGLVDPTTPDLRSDPREPRDLAIAARANWIVGFDNVSSLPAWLSDALCRLATGGGWATRELYTDFDEVLFEACRPVLLNGISDFIARPDLLDRAIQIHLPTIPDERRRDEKELWAAFEASRPRLLGALLESVAGAMRELPNVHLDRLPRMADFALWAVAAERAVGKEPRFLDAYAGVRAHAHEQAVEASPIGGTILALGAGLAGEPWTGTAAELLGRLAELEDEQRRRVRGWPTTPRALSGELRRLAPALRGLGLRVEFRREAKGRRTIVLDGVAETPSPSSPPSPPRLDAPAVGDGRAVVGDGIGDGWARLGDGGDGRPPLLSRLTRDGTLTVHAAAAPAGDDGDDWELF